VALVPGQVQVLGLVLELVLGQVPGLELVPGSQ